MKARWLLVLLLSGALAAGCTVFRTPVTVVADPEEGTETGRGASPAGGLTRREVVAYFMDPEPWIGHPGSHDVLAENGNAITTITGFWYLIDPQSADRLIPSGSTTAASIRRARELAAARGVRVEALFHNLIFDGSGKSREIARRILTEPDTQERLIVAVGRLVTDHGFASINVNVEWVRPEHRTAFTQFVARLAAHVRSLGAGITISVPAKTWDDPNHGWSGSFDYARLGEQADRVMLMTYDEHGYATGPGPIASASWVEGVVRYAITVIPRQKILLGVPGYGFDWTVGERPPRYLSHAQALELASRHGVGVGWDDASQTPRFSYRDAAGRMHQVWFENASATSWKLDLVDRYDLAGIALWRAGLEDPHLWNVIRQKYAVRKAASTVVGTDS